MPELLFYIISVLLKISIKMSHLNLRDIIFGAGRSTASWPWCNIVPIQSVHACRRYQNGPAFTSDPVNVFARLYKVMQDSGQLSFLQQQKNRTLTPSISPSQCSEQSMAVREYYRFVVHFYHFIDRPLFLFALLCMIIILLTHLSYCIFYFLI